MLKCHVVTSAKLIAINQVEGGGEVVTFGQLRELLLKCREVRLRGLGERRGSEQLEADGVVILKRLGDLRQFAAEFTVGDLLQASEIPKLNPRAQDLSEGLCINLWRAKELALDHEDGGLVVVDNDRIDLLVVRTIGDVVFGLDQITEVHLAQIPSDEPLSFVREVMDVVLLVDLLDDLLVHLRPPCFHR